MFFGGKHVFFTFKLLEKTGGSSGEAGGKPGGSWGKQAIFLGKHVFSTLKFLEKTGEANPPSTPFIILIIHTQQGRVGLAWGKRGVGPPLEFYLHLRGFFERWARRRAEKTCKSRKLFAPL